VDTNEAGITIIVFMLKIIHVFSKNDQIGNTVIKMINTTGYISIEVEDGRYVSNILLLNKVFSAAFSVIILTFHC